MGCLPGLWRSPGEGNGNSFQYSCLGNHMDREASEAIVHRVTDGQDWAHTHAHINCTPYTVHYILMTFILVLEVCAFWLPSSILPTLTHLWQPPNCSLYLWTLFLKSYFKIPHINETMWYFSLSIWFSSLSIMPSRYIHVVANDENFFFFWWLCVCVCVCVCVFSEHWVAHIFSS